MEGGPVERRLNRWIALLIGAVIGVGVGTGGVAVVALKAAKEVKTVRGAAIVASCEESNRRHGEAVPQVVALIVATPPKTAVERQARGEAVTALKPGGQLPKTLAGRHALRARFVRSFRLSPRATIAGSVSSGSRSPDGASVRAKGNDVRVSRASLLASRALWRRRAAFRHRRWTYWQRRPQTASVIASRRKWYELYKAAMDEVRRLTQRVQDLPKPRPSKRAAALAWAQSKVGIHEEPAGSNRGPQIDQWEQRFGFLGAPWCGLFAGNALLKAGVHGVTSRIASVAAIQEDAVAHRGCFSGWTSGSARGALRGDLVVLFGFGVHVEPILSVNADGSVYTIGGNTSATPGSGNQSDGGCVAKHLRSASDVHGVAHVHYG